MTNSEPLTVKIEPVKLTVRPSIPTWRYIGDRAAADLAYCARFGTHEAPDPTVALGGAWAYALPATGLP